MASLEAIIEQAIAEVSEGELARAREEFHARTGAFEAGEPFYEERIRAFFDWLAIEREGGAVLRGLAARLPAEGETITALLRSMRSLYRVGASRDGEHLVDCLLFGARFRLRSDEGPASRLGPGDVFDGRLAGVGGAVLLAPGPVFHPRQAHGALLGLLDQARAAGRCDGSLLDPLLRVRMRFDRFTSMHVRHVYRFDSIDRTEILAAPWARHAS